MNNANFTPISNTEPCSVKVTSTSQTKFNLPDLPNLRGKKVYGIEAFKVANVSKDSSGNALCNSTAQAYAFLILHVNGKEKIKEMPIDSLVASSNNGLIKNFDNLEIDYQKSYIQFAITTGLVANEVVLLNFYYKD